MLRVLSAIVFFIVLTLSFVFLQQNLESFNQAVSIQYHLLLININPVMIPVYVIMVLSWLSGLLLVFFLEMIAWIRIRGTISTQKRTINRMEKELQNLRTMPFSDDKSTREIPPGK